jgi:hypothetical protein
MTILDILNQQFRAQIALREKRPGVQQLFAPLFHEDGDMMDIFLDIPRDFQANGSKTVRISDHGMTVMRISYSFEIDTPNKERIFQRILAENGVQEENGTIFLDASVESLYPAILQFAQAISKVCNMRLFKREVLVSLFEEMLAEFITENLSRYSPRSTVYPIPERDDLEVDWEFKPNGVPLYLFGVKDAAKARLTTISCLEFQLAKLHYRSIVVHEDFSKLGRKDVARLTSACDKQFTNLDDFKQNATQYFAREIAA